VFLRIDFCLRRAELESISGSVSFSIFGIKSGTTISVVDLSVERAVEASVPSA